MPRARPSFVMVSSSSPISSDSAAARSITVARLRRSSMRTPSRACVAEERKHGLQHLRGLLRHRIVSRAGNHPVLAPQRRSDPGGLSLRIGKVSIPITHDHERRRGDLRQRRLGRRVGGPRRGLDLVVTRKGAISAKQGELGIIPGSMGTGSFIVAGLGSAESFHSASHGAGRRMSRAAAKRTFTTDDLAEQTAGVECRKDAGVVDEIPGAYKDLNQVMANQEDLVSVVARLETLLCVKG